MKHRYARRLLPALLDRSLPPRLEAGIRAHQERCGRCRQALAELEASERLLAALPASLLAPASGAAPASSEGRLRALARWAVGPDAPLAERVGATALGAAAVLAIVLLVSAFAGDGLPAQPGPGSPFAAVAAAGTTAPPP